MVLIMLSRLTICRPVPRMASREALIALIAAIALRSMAGDLHQSPDRIASQSEVVFHGNFGRVFDLAQTAAEHRRQSRRRH